MTEGDLAVVLDFEATCSEEGALRPQEVIELPSVLVHRERGVIDTFESFVRPIHHPQLTDFCTGLTSIQQADVDAAEPFPAVFERHAAWLASHGLHADNAVIVTCGDWDLNRMLPAQLRTTPVSRVPRIYSRWMNLKVPFKELFPGRRAGMKGMLDTLGLPLIGHHHRGIDDCHNLARLLLAFYERGVELRVTASWSARRWPPLPLVLVHRDDEHPVVLSHRSLPTLRGLASARWKQRVSRFVGPDGQLSEPDLLSLAAGARIHVELRE